MNRIGSNSVTEVTISIIVFTLLILLLTVLVMLAKRMVSSTSSFTIKLNSNTTINTIAGSQLLRALNDAGIPIPSGCAGAGTCGLCKVCVRGASTKLTPAESAHLSRKELQNGTRLACQVKVRNDFDVIVSDNILHAEQWTCQVTSLRQLSPLIKEITLKLPETKTMDFEPGSYVQVTAPAHKIALNSLAIDKKFENPWSKLDVNKMNSSSTTPTTRAYSMANKPEEQSQITLLIRLALPPAQKYHSVPPGKVSTWLFAREIGDAVSISGPFGDFYLRSSNRPMVLIGGGVGMAPLRSLLQLELQSPRDRLVSFFYGARSQWDVFYADELSELAKKHKRFSYTISLSEPLNGLTWNGETGFIHEIVKRDFLNKHPDPEICDYYLCGPPLMHTAVISALENAGVEPDSIFSDSFG